MTKTSKLNLAVAGALIIIGVSLRLLPHPANFAPITAIALFGGAVLPRRYGLWVPLAAMVVSDWFIGFHSLILVTWGCYLLIALAASRWMNNLRNGVLLILGSSVFFFSVTNFAVWATSGMYARTWSGLIECYTLALPFFRNSLLSDVFYTAVLFGAFALATRLSHKVLKAYRPSGV